MVYLGPAKYNDGASLHHICWRGYYKTLKNAPNTVQIQIFKSETRKIILNQWEKFEIGCLQVVCMHGVMRGN